MHPVKTPIYQALQIRELERLAEERFNILPDTLMQRAGKAALDFLQRRWPQAHAITVFCGTGNNGGDGFVLARLAHERGLKVSIWQVGSADKLSGIAAEARNLCLKHQISIEPLHAKADIGCPDVMVDAICGIGLKSDLREEAALAVSKMQRSRAPIFAIDVPTGIDADTGSVLGTAIHAAATMTFIGLKLGLLTGSGTAYTGELITNDLQLPAELFSYVEPVAENLHLQGFAHYLKPRARDWHKGLSGHVLVIGGELGFSGAPRMAGEAALRVGAGLVSIATRPENAVVMNAAHPELMCHGVSSAEELAPLLDKADILIIGPGLGQSDWAKTLWNAALANDLPKVIDADGLNLLAQQPAVQEQWILTPHPGEAARLLNTTVPEVQQDRLTAIKEMHKRYGGVCVLKGAGSLILAPNALPGLCNKGNPGMASAGMGDVLSGVIGGLLAQGLPLGEAAKMGVCLHASAGDLAAKDGERGMVATDLMPYLRRLSNTINQT